MKLVKIFLSQYKLYLLRLHASHIRSQLGIFFAFLKFDQDLAVTASLALHRQHSLNTFQEVNIKTKFRKIEAFISYLSGIMISDEVTGEDTVTELYPCFLPLSRISIPSPFSLQTNFSCNLFTSASFCSSLSFRADSSSCKDRATQ